jgi:hypothetical protein
MRNTHLRTKHLENMCTHIRAQLHIPISLRLHISIHKYMLQKNRESVVILRFENDVLQIHLHPVIPKKVLRWLVPTR